MAQQRIGRIVRMNRAGTGFLVALDQKSPSEFVFSADKIRRRQGHSYLPYRGEPVKSLGFTEGSQVQFSETNGKVDSVELK